jgi:hypothetical protein
MQATSRSHKIMRMKMFAALEQVKAQHRKYKRLKLGGGQAYDRSSD